MAEDWLGFAVAEPLARVECMHAAAVEARTEADVRRGTPRCDLTVEKSGARSVYISLHFPIKAPIVQTARNPLNKRAEDVLGAVRGVLSPQERPVGSLVYRSRRCSLRAGF